MKISIRTKLIAGFLFVFVFFIFAESYVVNISKEELEKTVGQSSVFLTEDLMKSIDKDIFEKVKEIRLFSQDQNLKNFLNASNTTFDKMEDRGHAIDRLDSEWISAPKEEITPFMDAIISNAFSEDLREKFIRFGERVYGERFYGEVFITNAYGANVAQTGKTSDYYQADEKWWQDARANGFSVGEIEYDESANLWSFPIGVRVDDGEGNFLGVIKAIPFAVEMVRAVERSAKKYETTSIRLLTKNGKLIYSTDAFDALEDVTSKNFFKNIKAGNNFFVDRENGKEHLFAYAHSLGFKDFAGFSWILVVRHDTEEVFRPVRELRQNLILLSSIFAFVIGLFVILLTRNISRPIQKLTKGAERLAQGNLDVRIDIKTQDEFGKLANSFNTMTVKLKESRQDLERMVEQRTKELKERVRELDATAKLLVRRDFEMLQLNERLREMDEAKSRFVSIAAHQIRTPLSGIKWTLQMMLAGDFGQLREDQRVVLRESFFSLNRLINLVADLLNVARIEEGRIEYKFSLFRPEELAKKIFSESSAVAESKKITMKLSVPEDTLSFVRGDFDHLLMAIQNIVDNAIAYTRAGGTIEIGAERDPRDISRVRIFVKDSGMGIPDSQKNLVGQKFFRGDNVVREQVSGTGLGLYIVKRILEKHEGELEFESEEGKGSNFFINLPFFKE